MTVLQPKNAPLVKMGANFTDRNKIEKMAIKGHSAEEISLALRIDLGCVVSFMPDPEETDPEETDPEETDPEE